jgi:hypothetical protein
MLSDTVEDAGLWLNSESTRTSRVAPVVLMGELEAEQLEYEDVQTAVVEATIEIAACALGKKQKTPKATNILRSAGSRTNRLLIWEKPNHAKPR